MLRRQARLRREYIYRKSLEQQDREVAEKRQRLRNALEESNQIPTDLRKDALALHKTLAWDDEGGDGPACSIDDEYRLVGVEDPKIVLSTSRDPSSKLKQFAKEVKLLLPNSQRINRGNYEMKQLVAACRANDVTDLILLQETRGTPDGMIISHLPHGPTAYFNLSGAVMRHDIPDTGTMSEAYPHLIFHNFTSKLGRRVQSILRALFPVPKEESRRVMTFANTNDYISFRHHTYKSVSGKVELSEVGPRFEMRLYKIVLSTLETADSGDVEWVNRPYMNTNRKRKFLSVS